MILDDSHDPSDASTPGSDDARGPCVDRSRAALHALRALDEALLDLAAERARVAETLDPALRVTAIGPERVADLARRGARGLDPEDVDALLRTLHAIRPCAVEGLR